MESSVGLCCVTDTQTLKHYVSEAGSASVFRREASNLFDPLDQAYLEWLRIGYKEWVKVKHNYIIIIIM